MDPMDTLIGVMLIASGIVFLYGAYKNKKVLGQDGILSQAISKGSLVSIDQIPDAFDTAAGAAVGKIEGRAGKIVPRDKTPSATQDPINAIAVVDQGLANQITEQLTKITKDSDRDDLMPLAQLLAIADGKGLTVSTGLIRSYIKGLTGESI